MSILPDAKVDELPNQQRRLLRALEGGEVVTRETLIACLQTKSFNPPNMLGIQVNRLRKALKEAQAAYRIDTVKGVGFRLAPLDQMAKAA